MIEKKKFVEAIRLLADVVERAPDDEIGDISFWSEAEQMESLTAPFMVKYNLTGWHNLNVTVRLYRDPTEEFQL